MLLGVSVVFLNHLVSDVTWYSNFSKLSENWPARAERNRRVFLFAARRGVAKFPSWFRRSSLLLLLLLVRKELYFKVSVPLTPSLHVIIVSRRPGKSFNFNHPPLSRHSAAKFFPIIVALLRSTLLSALFSISSYCLCLQIYLYHVFGVRSLVPVGAASYYPSARRHGFVSFVNHTRTWMRHKQRNARAESLLSPGPAAWPSSLSEDEHE